MLKIPFIGAFKLAEALAEALVTHAGNPKQKPHKERERADREQRGHPDAMAREFPSVSYSPVGLGFHWSHEAPEDLEVPVDQGDPKTH